MATKLTFWDTHNAEFPEAVLECATSEKVLKAVYILNDSALEDSEECDYAVFNCGYGDNTLNTEKRFGVSWSGEWPTTPRGDRYKHPTVRVSQGGKLQYQHKKMLRYPDKLIWVIHKEADGSRWLYKPQMLESNGCSTCYARGTKAYDVTKLTYMQILDRCNKDGFTYREVKERDEAQYHTAVPQSCRTPLATVYWSRELDGKSVMILLARYPKMTAAEIMMVLENEGASVDAQGIIHAKK